MSQPWIIQLLLLAALGATAEVHAETLTGEELGMSVYETPQQQANLGDGRAINLVCLGHGSPTVILSALKVTMAHLNADPERLLTQASLEAQHANGTSPREAINPRRNYGNMPLVVLTAGRDEASTLGSLAALTPGTPGAGTAEELAQWRGQISRFLKKGWGPAHAAYAALFTQGRHEVVPDSGHNIMIEKPDDVIAAINEVLDAIAVEPKGHTNSSIPAVPRS